MPETPSTDSLRAHEYSRIQRWLEVADFSLAAGLLVLLLATGAILSTWLPDSVTRWVFSFMWGFC
jgi:hypothetical protein